jgi:hypothetical protein
MRQLTEGISGDTLKLVDLGDFRWHRTSVNSRRNYGGDRSNFGLEPEIVRDVLTR